MVLAFIFLGCQVNPESTRTVYREREDGWFQFYTNDPSRHGTVFREVVGRRAPEPIITTPTFETTIFEIEVKKVSGNRLQGFGMIFGQVNNYRHFFININVDGQYAIGRRNLASTNPVPGADNLVDQAIPGRALAVSWIDSPRLNRGFNRSNIIRVERTGTAYTVFLNGHEVDTFTDGFISNADMNSQGHRIGFRASVGTAAQQAFPNTPVDVRFRIRTLPPPSDP